MEDSWKVPIRTGIRSYRDKSIFPIRIIRLCCTDFTVSDWITLIERNPNPSLLYMYSISEIFREISVGLDHLQAVARLCLRVSFDDDGGISKVISNTCFIIPFSC